MKTVIVGSLTSGKEPLVLFSFPCDASGKQLIPTISGPDWPADDRVWRLAHTRGVCAALLRLLNEKVWLGCFGLWEQMSASLRHRDMGQGATLASWMQRAVRQRQQVSTQSIQNIKSPFDDL